jgi:hypothetical protein
MARKPSKPVRFLVYISTSREFADDALVAFDERFEEIYDEFGSAYAHWWSISQGCRSLPYGAVASMIRVGIIIYRLIS